MALQEAVKYKDLYEQLLQQVNDLSMQMLQQENAWLKKEESLRQETKKHMEMCNQLLRKENARLKEKMESNAQEMEDLQVIKKHMEYCEPLIVREYARLKEEKAQMEAVMTNESCPEEESVK